ncbi:MAG: ABC transporter substrate-binding protein [Bauldia sp.]|nr:ABC transporter substrate-binding protein [Bauldia sp.]MCW5718197.1 ABC transporter substrate-binding protein [Bauldia sp.]
MSLASSIRRLAVAATVGTVIAAGPALAQGQPFRLIVVEPTTPLVLNSVMWLAEQLGYYEQEGVDVELVPVNDTPTAVAALIAGQGDMANVSLTAALGMVAQNLLPIKAVVSPDKFLPFSIVASNAIQSPADLAGKTFGVAAIGSLDYTLTNLVFAAIGVDPASVTFVAVGPPAQRGAALIAGQIDATTMSIGTYLGLEDKSNIQVLVPVDQYLMHAGILNKVNVVPDSVLTERRDDVVAVVRALTRAARDFAADPQLWIDAMIVARPDYDPANLAILAEQFRCAWSVNGGMDEPTITTGTTDAYGTADLAGMRMVEIGEWVDFTVADDANEALGGVMAATEACPALDPAGR